jgi:hypothetical protein
LYAGSILIILLIVSLQRKWLQKSTVFFSFMWVFAGSFAVANLYGRPRDFYLLSIGSSILLGELFKRSITWFIPFKVMAKTKSTMNSLNEFSETYSPVKTLASFLFILEGFLKMLLFIVFLLFSILKLQDNKRNLTEEGIMVQKCCDTISKFPEISDTDNIIVFGQDIKRCFVKLNFYIMYKLKLENRVSVFAINEELSLLKDREVLTSYDWSWIDLFQGKRIMMLGIVDKSGYLKDITKTVKNMLGERIFKKSLPVNLRWQNIFPKKSGEFTLSSNINNLTHSENTGEFKENEIFMLPMPEPVISSKQIDFIEIEMAISGNLPQEFKNVMGELTWEGDSQLLVEEPCRIFFHLTPDGKSEKHLIPVSKHLNWLSSDKIQKISLMLTLILTEDAEQSGDIRQRLYSEPCPEFTVDIKSVKFWDSGL